MVELEAFVRLGSEAQPVGRDELFGTRGRVHPEGAVVPQYPRVGLILREKPASQHCNFRPGEVLMDGYTNT